ncbi:MAG: biopolymer transporter ExbD [Planctomycetota bacterium]|nr:MAG: biopolymer transporter ExbD [Planctomycetota bacterium]
MARNMGDRRRQRKAGGGRVSVDSFSDLAFLLIIFFIVATTLMQSEGFEAQLPSATESAAENTQRNVPTIILESNRILYDTEEVDLNELRRRLSELNLADQEERLLIVRLQAMPSVPMSLYYSAWAAIANTGGIVVIVKESK